MRTFTHVVLDGPDGLPDVGGWVLVDGRAHEVLRVSRIRSPRDDDPDDWGPDYRYLSIGARPRRVPAEQAARIPQAVPIPDWKY